MCETPWGAQISCGAQLIDVSFDCFLQLHRCNSTVAVCTCSTSQAIFFNTRARFHKLLFLKTRDLLAAKAFNFVAPFVLAFVRQTAGTDQKRGKRRHFACTLCNAPAGMLKKSFSAACPAHLTIHDLFFLHMQKFTDLVLHARAKIQVFPTFFTRKLGRALPDVQGMLRVSFSKACRQARCKEYTQNGKGFPSNIMSYVNYIRIQQSNYSYDRPPRPLQCHKQRIRWQCQTLEGRGGDHMTNWTSQNTNVLQYEMTLGGRGEWS